jgi:hypothetical protein
VGAAHDPKVEISLPTDGLLYEPAGTLLLNANVRRRRRHDWSSRSCNSENAVLRLEADRRQKRLDEGELDRFEPVAPATDA